MLRMLYRYENWYYAKIMSLCYLILAGTLLVGRLTYELFVYLEKSLPEDSDMLDLIRDSMRYEISTVGDMGITSIVAGTGQGSGLASAYQKRKSVIERKLNEVSKKYARFNP